MNDAPPRIGLRFAAALDPRKATAIVIDDGIRDTVNRLQRIAARDRPGFEGGHIRSRGVGAGPREVRSVDVYIPKAIISDQEQAALDEELRALAAFTAANQIMLRRHWADGSWLDQAVTADTQPHSPAPDDPGAGPRP